MKLILALLMALVALPTMAQEIQPLDGISNLSNMIQRLVESPVAKQFARAEQKDLVENKAILGPTGELLPPALATQQLRGNDYFEWSLRWNKQQHRVASNRAVSATTIRGQLTRQSSFVQQGFANSGGLFRRGRGRNVTSSRSTTDTREQLWRVGGHGGGPVSIYNPFISDAALDSVSQ